MERGLTDSGEAIDPTRNRISGELDAGVVAEMVAVFGDQIVSISSVLLSKLLHQSSHLCSAHIGPSYQNRLPKRESLALLRLPFENSRRRMLVRSERKLHSMNCTKLFSSRKKK